MNAEMDYFKNHEKSRKFPWSIYHQPLENSLKRFFSEFKSESGAPLHVLCIGCGLWFEKNLIPETAQVTCIDIDARAVELLKNREKDPRVRAMVTQGEPFSELGDQKFDLIYAKEVIEHSLTPDLFLKSIRDHLKPGGRVWLSTPNYGEPWLPFFESTFLEWVARRDGFSRKHIHPTRFTRAKLNAALLNSGLMVNECRVIAARLAIVANATLTKT